ncbi:MAG: hypothetical protein A2096_13200 [Spirochaetes bacterium GWF1_41_5]|nr:MAG: hypothetical protein A2096_13200 [Spirochaetes bacterium GWF1_41_5]
MINPEKIISAGIDLGFMLLFLSFPVSVSGMEIGKGILIFFLLAGFFIRRSPTARLSPFFIALFSLFCLQITLSFFFAEFSQDARRRVPIVYSQLALPFLIILLLDPHKLKKYFYLLLIMSSLHSLYTFTIYALKGVRSGGTLGYVTLLSQYYSAVYIICFGYFIAVLKKVCGRSRAGKKQIITPSLVLLFNTLGLAATESKAVIPILAVLCFFTAILLIRNFYLFALAAVLLVSSLGALFYFKRIPGLVDFPLLARAGIKINSIEYKKTSADPEIIFNYEAACWKERRTVLSMCVYAGGMSNTAVFSLPQRREAWAYGKAFTWKFTVSGVKTAEKIRFGLTEDSLLKKNIDFFLIEISEPGIYSLRLIPQKVFQKQDLNPGQQAFYLRPNLLFVDIFRKIFWEISWNIAGYYPVFGVGPGKWRKYFYNEKYNNKLDQRHLEDRHFHAHNNFFNLLSESGFAAAFLYIFLVVYIFISTLLSLRRASGTLQADALIICSLSFLGINLAGIFDYTIFGGVTGNYFWTLAGICLLLSGLEQSRFTGHTSV